jgi:hypothetical protein
MKKNIRKIPKEVIAKLKKIGSDSIVAACAVRVLAADLSSGKLVNLGIELKEAGLVIPVSIIPPTSSGKYSSINIDGQVVVRNDLPLETHYHTIEAPNWGDSYNGTHEIDLPYKAYPREFHPPRETDIIMHASSKAANLKEYVISFRVNEVLDRKKPDFYDRLLKNLNLLQENLGTCDIEASETSLADYAKSLHLSWEILPPGTKEETIERLFGGRRVSEKDTEIASDRYTFFMTLNPKMFVYGSSGFRRYFGALINENLVLFENIEYGNAIYIMFGNWKELSRRSRIELLSGKFEDAFVRIAHSKDWKTSAKQVISEKSKGK